MAATVEHLAAESDPHADRGGKKFVIEVIARMMNHAGPGGVPIAHEEVASRANLEHAGEILAPNNRRVCPSTMALPKHSLATFSINALHDASLTSTG
jgi:hypothetical protein